MADLLKGDHSHKFHTNKHDSELKEHDRETARLSPVIHHGGLTEDQILQAFRTAGLTEIDFKIIHTIQKGGDEIDIFLTKGRKKAIHDKL